MLNSPRSRILSIEKCGLVAQAHRVLLPSSPYSAASGASPMPKLSSTTRNTRLPIPPPPKLLRPHAHPSPGASWGQPRNTYEITEKTIGQFVVSQARLRSIASRRGPSRRKRLYSRGSLCSLCGQRRREGRNRPGRRKSLDRGLVSIHYFKQVLILIIICLNHAAGEEGTWTP